MSLLCAVATICHGAYIGHGQAISSQNVIRQDEHEIADYSHGTFADLNNGYDGLNHYGLNPEVITSSYVQGYPSVEHYHDYKPLAVYAPEYKSYVSCF